MKTYNIKVNGNDYSVTIDSVDGKMATVSVNGTDFNVELESSILVGGGKPVISSQPVAAPAQTASTIAAAVSSAPISRPTNASSGGMKSPLPGAILDVFVKEGDTVTEGQRVMILEAMKMENNIEAEKAGVVTKLAVSKGSTVMEGDLLIIIE